MKRSIFSRISAIVLSCVLILSLLPTVVFAQNSAAVSSVSELNSALNNAEVKEIHIVGSFTYKSGLTTDKTVIIDNGSVFTWNFDKGDFRTEKLVVNGSFVIIVEESFVNRLHVYGTVENNGNIKVESETGNCFWHAPTTGDGTFVGTERTYVDYGTFASDKIPTNAKVNLMKDVTQTWNVKVSLNQDELVPGNTVIPDVSNLFDGVNVSEVFDMKWKNPPNTNYLSKEPHYTIPLDMGGEKLQVSVTCKPGYALVTSNGTRGTMDSEVYIVNKPDNTTLYVDSANGSNANVGTEKAPLETLTYALRNVDDNGTIVILGDYDSKNDGISTYYVYNNVTIKGGSTEKSKIITNKQISIKDGATVTFDNIDFGSKYFWITKYSSSSAGTANIVFNNVSASNLSIDEKNSVNVINSNIGGRVKNIKTITFNNSALNGSLTCDDFVAVGDVSLTLNSVMEINKNVSVEKAVGVSPSTVRNDKIIAKVPSNDSKWASYFVLNDNVNGKYDLKCRTIDGSAYVVVAEKAVASGPLYVAFVPSEESDVGNNGNIGVPDKFFADVSSAVWSGYSDADGQKWQAGDVPELTVVLTSDKSSKSDKCYYFNNDFTPGDFTFYNWGDTSQSADNFLKDEYKLSDVKAVVKSGQGVSDDGKSFTFTLQFPKIAHKLTKTDYKAPNCTEAGNIEYWQCENCKKYFSDEAGTKEITKEQTVLNALNHPSTVLKNAKEATCTEEGYSGDKYCTECGALVEAGKVIPAKGHSFGTPKFNWSEDGKTCSAVFACTVCGETKTENASVTSKVKTAPTCQKMGVTAYTAAVELNGNTYSDTKEITDIPVIAHNFENGVCTMCGEKDPNFKPTVDNNEPTTGNNDTESDSNSTVNNSAVNNNGATTAENSNNSKNDNAKKDENKTSPDTGSLETAVILGVLLMAGGLLSAVNVYGKKKRSEK